MGFPVADLDGLEGRWHLEGTVLVESLVEEVVHLTRAVSPR
jgi:hypothetical protein